MQPFCIGWPLPSQQRNYFPATFAGYVAATLPRRARRTLVVTVVPPPRRSRTTWPVPRRRLIRKSPSMRSGRSVPNFLRALSERADNARAVRSPH